MVKFGARLREICNDGFGVAIRKAYNRLLAEELHAALATTGWGNKGLEMFTSFPAASPPSATYCQPTMRKDNAIIKSKQFAT